VVVAVRPVLVVRVVLLRSPEDGDARSVHEKARDRDDDGLVESDAARASTLPVPKLSRSSEACRLAYTYAQAAMPKRNLSCAL